MLRPVVRKIHRLLYAESRKKRRGANKKNIPEPKRSCESALFFANPFSRQLCADPRQMPLWQLMAAWGASVPIIARFGRSREIFPNLPNPRPLDHAKGRGVIHALVVLPCNTIGNHEQVGALPRRMASGFRVFPPDAKRCRRRKSHAGICDAIDAWSNPRPGSVVMQHDRKSRAGRGFAAPYDEWFPCVSARREALQAAQIPRGDL